MDIKAIQQALQEEALDAWLFYYFHENDPLALRILDLDQEHFFSRRWYYLVPAIGEPRKLVHRIEADALDSLPGQKDIYLGWRQLEEKLEILLSGTKRVAMQYSPRNAVPYISKVDAGVVELVRSCGCEVISSADLISRFESTIDELQLASHIRAVELLKQIVHQAFRRIKQCIENSEPVNEYQIQQFICNRFSEEGLVSNSPPIVAVNSNSGSPHYQPTVERYAPIRKDDFVLIDLWAKLKEPPDSIYGDITWTAFVGDTVPEKYNKIFDVVAGGRNVALEFVRQSVAKAQTLYGFQVDDAARDYIKTQGFGDYFIHRTGHSICQEVHANGANMDNLETKEERKVIANTCFSIEPGVYLEDFGIRSEIDVFVGKKQVIVAGEPIQSSVIPLLTANY